MTVRSAIYRGSLRHRRHGPPNHTFTHSVGLLYLDLDELPSVLEHAPLWSASRRALGRVRRQDYMGNLTESLKAAVARTIAEQADGAIHEGPVRLLTSPRTFGRSFNPVSFYYCFAPDGKTLEFVVAEVTNTPWGERHSYVLDTRGDARPTIKHTTDKVFHVSPFMSMEHRYAWSLTIPGPTLSINVDSVQRDGVHAFDATLNLRRQPLNATSLCGLLARFPFAALRVLVLIYAHALGLKLKGARHFPHPASS